MTPLDFVIEFNYLSPETLDDILETLYDNKMLNKNGEEFKKHFYTIFIQAEYK